MIVFSRHVFKAIFLIKDFPKTPNHPAPFLIHRFKVREKLKFLSKSARCNMRIPHNIPRLKSIITLLIPILNKLKKRFWGFKVHTLRLLRFGNILRRAFIISGTILTLRGLRPTREPLTKGLPHRSRGCRSITRGTRRRRGLRCRRTSLRRRTRLSFSITSTTTGSKSHRP